MHISFLDILYLLQRATPNVCDTQTIADVVSTLDKITSVLTPYYPVGWAIIIVRKILLN